MGFALTHAGSRYLRYKPLPHTGFLTFCALLLAMAACVAASANDGAIVGVGGAMKLMQAHPSVRLVSESVTVRISEERTDRNNDLYADVDCVFVFQNTGDAVEVEMGFPEFGWGAWTSLGRMTGTTGFLSFTSQVDGQPWPTEVVDSQVAPNESLQRWRVKTIPFAAGQRRTIRDSYRMLLGSTNWTSAGSMHSFSYILDTGASWQGTIGRASMSVDFSGVRSYALMDAAPLVGMKEPQRQVIGWEWRDFEPTAGDSVHLAFVPERYAVMLHGIRYGGTSLSDRSFVGLYAEQVQWRDGEVMVPVNALADCLGRWSHWDPKTKVVSFGGSREKRIVVRAGRREITIGRDHHSLPVAPYIALARHPYYSEFQAETPPAHTMFVPLRAITRLLGGEVRALHVSGPQHAFLPG